MDALVEGAVRRGPGQPSGRISVAGTSVPKVTLDGIEEWMRREPFTTDALAARAKEMLAEAGLPINIAHVLSQRLIHRAKKEGRIGRLPDTVPAPRRRPLTLWILRA